MDFLLLYYRAGLLVADAPLVGVEVVQAVAYVLREAEGDILVGQEHDARDTLQRTQKAWHCVSRAWSIWQL